MSSKVRKNQYDKTTYYIDITDLDYNTKSAIYRFVNKKLNKKLKRSTLVDFQTLCIRVNTDIDKKVMKRNDFKFESVLEFWDTFRTEEDCIKYLEEIRWNKQSESPFDPKSKVYKCKNGKYKCKNTNKYFTVLTGTIFHNTKIPLRAWFYGLYCLTNIKNGKSARQIAKDIHISHYRALKIENTYLVLKIIM